MSNDPITVVLAAFNAHDANAFAAAFADDGEMFDYPDKVAGKGRAEIGAYMGRMFAAYPQATVELVGQIDLGLRQITHERFDLGDGSPRYDAALVYILRDAEIIRMDFVREQAEVTHHG